MTNKSKILRFCSTFLILTLYSFLVSVVFFAFNKLSGLIFNFINIELNYTFLIPYFLLIVLVLLLEYFLLKLAEKFVNKGFIKRHKIIGTILLIILTIVSCCLSFIIGLPFGTEAPSVLIAFILGFLFFNYLNDDFKKYFPGIGFSIAFLNPLAGLFYSFENFKIKILNKNNLYFVYVLLVSYLFYIFLNGNYIYLNFINITSYLEPLYLCFIPIIGIISFILGFLYKNLFYLFRYLRNKFSFIIFVILTFILIFALKFISNDFVNNGSIFFENILNIKSIYYLLLLVFIRLFLMLFTYNTKLAGGRVIPTLTLGYLFGYLFCYILSYFINLDPSNTIILSITFMVCFYAVVSNNHLTSLAISFSFLPINIIFLPALIGLVINKVLCQVVKNKSMVNLIYNNDLQFKVFDQLKLKDYMD